MCVCLSVSLSLSLFLILPSSACCTPECNQCSGRVGEVIRRQRVKGQTDTCRAHQQHTGVSLLFYPQQAGLCFPNLCAHWSFVILVYCVSLGWRLPVIQLFVFFVCSRVSLTFLGSLGGDAGSDGPLRAWSSAFPSFVLFGRGLQSLFVSLFVTFGNTHYLLTLVG